ncbi:MAG: hypothetical protein ACRDPC_28565 [Solirubrobacteraceae bacterium]
MLAYRALAIWLPAPIGLATLGALRRTIVRWSREDAPLPHAPSPVTSLESPPAPAWTRHEPALQRAA